MFGEKRHQYLRRRTDGAAAPHVTAEYSTARVAHRHMQMRAIGGNGPGEREDLQIVAQLGRLVVAGKSQLGNTEAPDALDREGRLHPGLTQDVFDGRTEIVAGKEA